MKLKIKKLTSLLLILVLTFSFTSVFAEEEEVNRDILANKFLDVVIDNVAENYKFGVDEAELYRNALREIIAHNPEMGEYALQGIYGNLDQYSTYYTEEEFLWFLENISGEFCGIGVTIMEFHEGLMVTEVHKDSAAEKAGLRQGDIIISADGVDIRGMDVDEARNYIVGLEGTPVQVGISRDGEELYFDMVRGKVTTIPGFYQMLEGNIGYIQLSSFDDQAPQFMAEAIMALNDAENIIIDLRYNPGGSLESLEKIAAMTLPKGPVMHLEYKNPINNTTITNNYNGFNHKLVVLVNNYTASAAEAFSAAVQDHGVGVVVGEQTTGKGTMQVVNPLFMGGGYKLTVAEYLSPNKRTINNIGVEPDYKVVPQEVKYSDVYFTPVTYERVLRVGDTGDDVLALEQRLDVLGYGVGVPDKVYDEETYYAVKKYQDNSGLYPYGVLDFTTQTSIVNALQNQDVVLDKPFDKAVELASGDMDAIIKEVKAERK
ncbi:MAG: PDZ domain-containing protein [Clostridia bacterium]|nr:PDZ domain-containing protein [Clostridia bacterium]